MAGKSYKLEWREITLGDALSDAQGDLQSLAEEMGEWQDSMEDKFSGTEKYSRVSDAADACETASSELESIKLPEDMQQIKIKVGLYFKTGKQRGRESRQTRCDNAVSMLDAVISEVQALIDSAKEKGAKLSSSYQEMIDEIENTKRQVDDLEFPGMYG